MQCPHCNYQHGWVGTDDDIENVKGAHGEFWKLCVPMEKQDMWESRKATLRACPMCLKTFIGDDDVC